MRPHAVIVAAIALVALTTARAGAQGATSGRVAGWGQDANDFVDALGSQHYLLSQKPLPDSVRAALQRFRAGVPLWSDDRALAELMRIAALAGDGHTYVLPFSAAHVASHCLPLRFYQFSDGLFVIDALPGYERWIGARVRQIAGLPIDTAVARLRPYMARDNDSYGRPSEWGTAGFYPRVPQFADAPPRKPVWQLHWIVQHGVRYTGMGAWERLAPDSTIWQVVTFLSHLDSLPPAVDAQWRKSGP